MKQERGITTSTVIIYIVVMIIIIATLTVISGYFHKIIKTNITNNEYDKKYTTFLSYFVEEIQKKGNEIITANTTEELNYIEFSDGNIYKYDVKNKKLYKNNIKISDNIGYCKFDYEEIGEKKYKVIVDFAAGKFVKIGQDALIFYIV